MDGPGNWFSLCKRLREIHRGQHRPTVGRMTMKLTTEYWAIRSSIRSFARTAHSFAFSALLASLARSATPIRSLTRSFWSSWESDLCLWIDFIPFHPTVHPTTSSPSHFSPTGLVINIIHSLCTCAELKFSEETLRILRLSLTEFSLPKFYLLFGISKVKSAAVTAFRSTYRHGDRNFAFSSPDQVIKMNTWKWNFELNSSHWGLTTLIFERFVECRICLFIKILFLEIVWRSAKFPTSQHLVEK